VFADVRLTSTMAKPLLPLTTEERRWLQDHFDRHYHPPLFWANDEQRKQQHYQSFLTGVRKVPVYWLYEQYGRGTLDSRFSSYWVNLIYSDGTTFNTLRVAGDECPIAIWDGGCSWAILEPDYDSDRVLMAMFDPHAKW